MPHPPLILASTSRYRQELLGRLHLPFDMAAPPVDETPLPAESPRATALRLAEAKARAVAEHHVTALVIGADQVADLNGAALGKPGDHLRATAQLRAMRGQRVVFHTALCLVNTATGRVHIDCVPTVVHLRVLHDDEIEQYLRIDAPYDCAGSAKVESLGIALADAINSVDPTALIGLPLISLARMLREEGVNPLMPA